MDYLISPGYYLLAMPGAVLVTITWRPARFLYQLACADLLVLLLIS